MLILQDSFQAAKSSLALSQVARSAKSHLFNLFYDNRLNKQGIFEDSATVVWTAGHMLGE